VTHANRRLRTAAIVLGLCLAAFLQTGSAQNTRLIIRADDLGMTEGSLEAIERGMNQGVLCATSVLVPGPWFEAAAALCRRNAGWCTGVHLCLVGEWQGFRWRPVLPWSEVRSVVDEDGFLYPSPTELFAHKPRLAEMEAEMRAQVELARKKGVRVQYVDTHYMSARQYPGLEDVVRRIAADYRVPYSSNMGEQTFASIEKLPVEQKLPQALKQLDEIGPGLWLWFCHPGIDSPEQRALVHTAPEDIFLGGGVGAHRSEVLRIMTSLELRSFIQKKGIQLVTYRDVAAK
jgi:chitin disaccharide deacetylase